MRSVGYDIVDLSLTDPARSASPRFYRQILAPTDAASSLPFHQHLWLCWSVKEAVYKYVCRYRPGTVFPPTRIVLSGLDASLRAEVRWEGQVYTTQSFVGDGYIVSVASDGAPLRSECIRVSPSEDASAAVRRLVLASFGPGWSVERRADGCTTLVGPTALPLSLSHHGAYAGYSLVLP